MNNNSLLLVLHSNLIFTKNDSKKKIQPEEKQKALKPNK